MDRCELLCLDLPKAEALRKSRPGARDAAATAAAAKALGDELRVQLAEALGAGGELCVCDLAWIVERPQNLTSHHLAVMRRGGVVEARRDGKMVMYSLSPLGVSMLSALRAGLSA